MQVLINQVEKLRAKPEHHRRAWTLGLSACLTAVVALLWGFNLSITLSTPQLANKAEPVSPFGQVAGVALTNIGSVKDGFLIIMGDLVGLFK